MTTLVQLGLISKETRNGQPEGIADPIGPECYVNENGQLIKNRSEFAAEGQGHLYE